jgi:hypothetical protein
VEIDGERNLVLREDLDSLADAASSPSVRLLPAYDQWILGPGTADSRVVPTAHRALVSKGANVVIVGGIASGTWTVADAGVSIEWFPGSNKPPDDRVRAEVGRLATILDLPPDTVVRAA